MIYRRAFVIGKLDNVRMFVERALSVYDDYVRIADGDYESPDEVGEEESFMQLENALDMLMVYQEMVARSALNEVNSIVEYELKLIASITLSKESGKSLRECWQRNRATAVKIIEKKFVIKLSNLVGYREVELVRKTINAYKHDEGYSENEYEFFASIDDVYAEVQKKYPLNIDDVLNCIGSAKEFVRALPNLNLKLGADANKRLKIVPRNKGKP